ncbi:hypothetical protein JTE90_000147 [Oedothorax gibbosus]|uniref:Secreted protein n=1 Tax=Oedothorax gibbosus TaxID=931172 RepID=A0AAV6U5N2_9ARAC|nr:hypothetical protein JTE90_000147 [Oedothorax gibbosus]
MLSLIGILSVASYCDVVLGSWATPGTVLTDGNVRRCYDEMEKDSDISHLLLDTTSGENISRFCGRISFLKKCVAKFEHQLSNSENTEYLQKTQGISTFYLNVCPPGTDLTEKYKRNANCFQLIKTEILSCGSDLPSMSSYKMKNDLNARCCALMKHRDCTSWAAGDKCGKEAETVLEELLQRYYLPQLEGCTERHMLSCQQNAGQDSSVEDWSKTTLAEEWRKHRPKHNSGETNSAYYWNVLVVYFVVFCFIT